MRTQTKTSGRGSVTRLLLGGMALLLLAAGCEDKTSPTELPAIPAAGSSPALSDSSVARAIERQLLWDPSVASHGVRVRVDDGIVRLTGEVADLRARRRAVEIAQAIRGVKSVVDELAVKAAFRPDNEVQADVKQALLADPATGSWNVDVSVNGGKVSLRGTVGSWEERELAGWVATGVRGVAELDNQLAIRSSTHSRPDREIKGDVVGRLRRDVRVEAPLVDVKVKDGTVFLSGTVGSASELMQATRDAWVDGVTAVDNQKLKVRWWYRDRIRERFSTFEDDGEIRQAIKGAFFYDPRVASFNPEVTVKHGIVTLSGSVTNLAAKRAAERDARNTVGVLVVNNHLDVEPGGAVTSEELAARVSQTLERDPVLQRYDLTVTALNGAVVLGGTVPSAFDRQLAEQEVARVQGVEAITDNIGISPGRPRSDAKLKRSIETALLWSPFVGRDAVKVTVEDGVATLSGTVSTDLERYSAAQAALDAGADRVHNKLELGYQKRR